MDKDGNYKNTTNLRTGEDLLDQNATSSDLGGPTALRSGPSKTDKEKKTSSGEDKSPSDESDDGEPIDNE